ncbi:MAG: divergent family protein [Paenibacillus sp.]|jgi:acid phosphatase family membrane protein YuiD|nr:divergent family protein [Paenibacillus sp.]
MTALIHNFPLIAALSAIVLAQFIKVPLFLFMQRSWNPAIAFSTGGMPSSHAAAVTSLTTAIAWKAGVSSTGFAIGVVLSAITMFDAAGIRRHAGIHASFINRLMTVIRHEDHSAENHPVLKEMLGHRPIEVIAGAIFGIAVSTGLYWLFYR